MLVENGVLSEETFKGEIQLSRDTLNKLSSSPLEKWIYIIFEIKVGYNLTDRRVLPVKKKQSPFSYYEQKVLLCKQRKR